MRRARDPARARRAARQRATYRPAHLILSFLSFSCAAFMVAMLWLCRSNPEGADAFTFLVGMGFIAWGALAGVVMGGAFLWSARP